MSCVTTCSSALRRPLLALVLTACAPHRANTLPATDAELLRQYPCPAAIPAAWTAVDSTLGRPPRCALVVAAMHVLSGAAKRDTALARVDTAAFICARARRVSYQGDSATVVSGTWLVELYRATAPRVLVSLAPRGGTSHARLVPSPAGADAMALCAAS